MYRVVFHATDSSKTSHHAFTGEKKEMYQSPDPFACLAWAMREATGREVVEVYRDDSGIIPNWVEVRTGGGWFFVEEVREKIK